MTDSKYIRICDQIVKAISSGELKAGERLPGERRIAEQYGVSHMTARRAVGELVTMGFVQRSNRSGTFVCGVRDGGPGVITLNVICLGFGEPTHSLIRHAKEHTAKQGWHLRVIQCHGLDESEVIRIILSGHPSLILSDDAGLRGPIGKAAQQAGGRAVIVGNRLDWAGAPSVLCDDAKGMRLAMEHLMSHGHRRIGVVAQKLEGYIEHVMIDTWRSCCTVFASADVQDRRLINVRVPRFEDATSYAFEAVRRRLVSRELDVTALVCLTDQVAMGVLSACQNTGYQVPEKMSIMSFGNTSLAAFVNPRVTSIDVDYGHHMAAAVEFVNSALAGEYRRDDCLSLVDPRLVSGATVAQCSSQNTNSEPVSAGFFRKGETS